MRSPIFIGGTGRCGTSVVHDIVAESPDVASRSEGEVRILTDPGGLLDLYDALARRWTPFRADAAIERFYDLVTRHTLVEEHEEILEYLYSELGLPNWMQSISLNPRYRKGSGFNVPHYRQNWDDLHYHERQRLAADVLKGLWDEVLFPEGGDRTVDSTPENLLAWQEIRDVWPGSDFVHIVRDPLDVLSSMLSIAEAQLTPKWWPEDTEALILHVRHTLEAAWDVPGRWIRLENLVEEPEEHIENLCRYLQVEPSDSMVRVVGERNAHLGRHEEDDRVGDYEARLLQEIREVYGYA